MPTPAKAARKAVRLVTRGIEFSRQRDLPAAEKCYRQALALDPLSADAHYNLGTLRQQCGAQLDAERLYRRAIELFPAHAEAYANLGNVYLETGRAEQALASFAKAIELRPAAGGVLQMNLANAYQRLERLEEAAACIERALQCEPGMAPLLLNNLANLRLRQNRVDEAVRAAEEAVRLAPGGALERFTLSNAYKAQGRYRDALTQIRSALFLDPGSSLMHSAAVFLMNYHPDCTPEAVSEEACRWNARHAAPLAGRRRPHANPPDPERRLRVGYVSADFTRHVVSQFVEPVFEHHDRGRVEVYAYSSVSKPDDVTERMMRLATGWRSAVGLSDGQLAEQIRADGIDILVDLSGHTAGNRLLAFALKPAPVQVTWLGYANTTGLDGMDYFLGDPYYPAPGSEALFSERVFRLPRSFACCRPRETAAELPLAPPPAMGRGYVTFGCFNNPAKITREVVQLWSALLHLAPEARLLLKYAAFDSEALRAAYRGWFAEDGVDPARVEFRGGTPHAEHLAAHNEVDIALDPFPYNGGTSTLDALWMGVPVVALAGQSPFQRVCASMLASAGLAELIASTPAQYLNTALYLAQNVARLPRLREEIRQQLARSAWMDEAGFTRELEDGYRAMWREWCAAQTGSGGAEARP